MATFRDFDAFRAEAAAKAEEKPGPQFTLYGETYTLPRGIPMALMIEAARIEEGRGTDDPKAIVDIAYSIFGREAVDFWATHSDFDTDLLEALISWVPEAYEAFHAAEAAEAGDDSGN